MQRNGRSGKTPTVAAMRWGATITMPDPADHARMSASVRLLPVLLIAGVAGAAEPRLCDLRVFAEQRPAGATFRWHDTAGGSDGTVDFDTATGIGAGARWGWGRPGLPWLAVLGVEGVVVRETFPGGDRTASILRLELAYAQALDDSWLLVIGPVAGGGPSRTRLAGGAIRPAHLTGSLLEGGLRAGLRWSMSRRWSLGAEGGWLAGRDRASGDGAELTWDRAGPWAGLALAFTLDPSARRLE